MKHLKSFLIATLAFVGILALPAFGEEKIVNIYWGVGTGTKPVTEPVKVANISIDPKIQLAEDLGLKKPLPADAGNRKDVEKVAEAVLRQFTADFTEVVKAVSKVDSISSISGAETEAVVKLHLYYSNTADKFSMLVKAAVEVDGKVVLVSVTTMKGLVPIPEEKTTNLIQTAARQTAVLLAKNLIVGGSGGEKKVVTMQ